MATLFTKIIKGEIPSYTVYEDDLVFAFLDIYPYQKGHTLIVPKIEVDYFVDVPEPYYSQVFQVAKKIAPAIQKSIQCLRIGTLIYGIDVPHFHYHLIPIHENEPILAKKKEFSKEEMIEVQTLIIKNLEQ